MRGPKRGSLRFRRRGLLLHRDFLIYWTGESISSIGSQVSGLAIPLTAVLLLHASEGQMGLLGAASSLPFAVIGLLSGVWVDRVRRRPLLIGVNLGQAALMGSIPLAALLDRLSMVQLYVVAFAVGSLVVVGTAAYQAFLPALVGRRRLVESNAKLQISESVAIVVGPSLGGLLVQWLTAPIAVAVDAISFIAAALGLLAVRRPEPPPRPAAERGSVVTEIREGLQTILGDPRLRLITLAGATHNFFANGMIAALYVIYAVQTIGLSPAELGLALAAGGPGVLIGAVLASRVPKRIGVGPAMAHMQTLTGLSRFVVAAAATLAPPFALVALMVGEFLLGVARPIFNVTQVSLRQAVTPDRLLGRMNASIRFLMWVSVPVGGIAGGVVGTAFGLPVAMTIGAVGTLLAAIWLYLPSVWRIRVQPKPVR